MTTNPISSLSLHPSDLTYKWGFDDGDLTGTTIDEWASTNAWGDPLAHRVDHPVHSYVSSTVLLLRLVQDHLVPILPALLRDRLVRIHTVHNPVRLDDMDEVDDEREAEYDRALDSLDDLPAVVVSGEAIAVACDELFDYRPDGWLAMFAALRFRFEYHQQLSMRYAMTGLYAREPWFTVKRRLDELASHWSDDEFRLAAELLKHQFGVRDDRDDDAMLNALHSARLVMRDDRAPAH